MGGALDGLAGKFTKLGKVSAGADSKMRLGHDKQLTGLADKLAKLRASQQAPARVGVMPKHISDELDRARGAAGKSGAAAEAFRAATALQAQKKAAEDAAKAMDRLRAASKASASKPMLSARTMGTASQAGLGAAPNVSGFAALLQKLLAVHPAAGRAALGIAQLTARADNATRSLGGLGGMASKAGGALMSIGAFAVKAAAIVGAAFLAMGVAAAKYIGEMQALKQSTVFAFAASMGGQAQAIAGWEKMVATAIKIGAPLDMVSKSMTMLMAQGFSFDAADALVKRMADLKALNPSANLEKIALAIAQIKAKGKLSQEELSGQLAETGLSPDMVYEALSKKLGKDKASVIKMITAGQIDSKTGIEAIEEAMKKQTGGGAAGAMAEKMASTTILGGIGRLTARVQGFAAGLKINFAPAAKFMDRIGVALEGESGQKFGKALEDGMNTALGLLDRITQKDIESVFSGAADVINGVTATVRTLASAWDWVQAVGARLDQIKASMGALGTAASAVGTAIWSSLSFLGSALLDMVLGPILAIGRALMSLFGAIGRLAGAAGITMPEIPKELIQATTSQPAKKETPEEIVRRVTATDAQKPPATAEGAAPQATTSKVDVGVDIVFNTAMFEARVREIVQQEAGKT
jgi:tape measure domain-containing protein